MSVISLDEHHASLVAHRTGIAWLERGALAIGLQSVLAWCRRVGHQGIVTLSQEGTAVGELGLAVTISHKTEVPDLVQALGQNMQAEAAQEFHRVEGLGAQLTSSLMIFEAEGYLAVLEGNQTVVRDGDAVGVASQVLEDMRRVTGFFGVDDPFLLPQRRQQAFPDFGLGELPAATRQGQLALVIELLEPLDIESPKAPREDPYR